MLILPLKPAVRFDIRSALANWLDNDDQQNQFGSRMRDSTRNPLEFIIPKPSYKSVDCYMELTRLQSLRHCICDSILKPAAHQSALEESALDDCYEYHAVLLEFEKRGFPTTDDYGDRTKIQLTWKGAFALAQQEDHASLIWDRTVIMYNIVALLTAKISSCSLNDRDECKQAVSYCQTGAGILTVLKQLVQSQDYHTVDVSIPMITFWERALLAQAQSCIYRMASLNTSGGSTPNHGTLAMLSQSAHLLFNSSLQATQDPRLQSDVPRQAEDWGSYCKAQSMLAAGKAEYHKSVTHRLAGEWGKEIARLSQCVEKLDACSTFCKTLDVDGNTNFVRRECAVILPVVRDRYNEANNDNYKIYQDEIPKKMDDIEAKQLARMNAALPEYMLIPKKTIFGNL